MGIWNWREALWALCPLEEHGKECLWQIGAVSESVGCEEG